MFPVIQTRLAHGNAERPEDLRGKLFPAVKILRQCGERQLDCLFFMPCPVLCQGLLRRILRIFPDRALPARLRGSTGFFRFFRCLRDLYVSFPDEVCGMERVRGKSKDPGEDTGRDAAGRLPAETPLGRGKILRGHALRHPGKDRRHHFRDLSCIKRKILPAKVRGNGNVPDHFRQRVPGLIGKKHREDAVLPAEFNEILHFPETPFGSQIILRTKRDEPGAFFQCAFDIRAQIRPRGKLVGVPEHPPSGGKSAVCR